MDIEQEVKKRADDLQHSIHCSVCFEWERIVEMGVYERTAF